MNKVMQVFTGIVAVGLLLAVIGVIFYFGGIKKYGTPAQYKRKQMELMQAHMDSLKIVEGGRLLPENIADSTLFGVGRHTEIFESVEKSEDKLKMIHSSLDSLAKERKTLEDKEKAVDLKLNVLETNSDLSREENVRKLAKIYDSMKATQALPLIKNMNDTTAVSIISLMTERNASRLLGALAETDIEKATRLNKLLANIEKKKK